MPAPHEYYSKHSRKVTSSQMSLPEQLQNTSNDEPARLMALLPATTYNGIRQAETDPSSPVDSPDAFYRQIASPTGVPLRQVASRTTGPQSETLHDSDRQGSPAGDRSFASENGLPSRIQENTRSHLNSPGLRSRKSSVKILVDQLNASLSEPHPPMPVVSVSQGGSRNVSPTLPSDAQVQRPNVSRQLFGSAAAGANPRSSVNGNQNSDANAFTRHGKNASSASLQSFAQSRRPLFGEVMPSLSDTYSPGYGIQTLRKRSGSEGSPLPSPSFMRTFETESATRSIHDVVTTTEPIFTLSPAVYVPKSQTHHRRANSDSPSTPTRNITQPMPAEYSQMSNQQRNLGGPSRIPVSVQRGSTSSDLENDFSNFATDAGLVLDTLPGEHGQTPRNRRPRSPPQIQSPAQRSKNSSTPQGSRSPLLRANIIVPPPKVSPALRSSRPRLPVSSASTAASRAKMAEKFSALQKLNEEKRRSAKRSAKPPELSDVDLKARRLRITQALTRSLEGQDLKGHHASSRGRDLSTSRTASPAMSDNAYMHESDELRNGVPAVVIDGAVTDNDALHNVAQTHHQLRQERSFSQNALEVMEGDTKVLGIDVDSPTLGPPGLFYANKPTRLQTNLDPYDRSDEPSSAMTEGTMIDPEPQDELGQGSTHQSILSQINRMRSQDSLGGSAYDTFSSHGDKESVQIFLRDTLYLDEDEAIRRGLAPTSGHVEPAVREAVDRHTQRSSWISSVEDSDDEREHLLTQPPQNVQPASYESELLPSAVYQNHSQRQSEPSVRSTMASDAYTIVNFVLQRHSTTGEIDHEFVHDVYQRVLEDSPYGDGSYLTPDRIEQICLQEIQDRVDAWNLLEGDGNQEAQRAAFGEEDATTPRGRTEDNDSLQQTRNSWLMPEANASKLAPPPFFKGHRYKSSLDSAEDFLDTSPSVSDWMIYQVKNGQKSVAQSPTSPIASEQNASQCLNEASLTHLIQPDGKPQTREEDQKAYAALRSQQSHTPPPLAVESGAAKEESPHGYAIIQRPQIPRRVTSISQLSRDLPQGRQSPSASAPVLGKVSTEEAVTPDQRRLKQRRNVIKELVDTEFTYERDLRVLCDIYKQTASVALTDEDVRVLFGNVEQVQIFSKDFLMLLKSLAKPTYAMERQDRKKDKSMDQGELSVRPRSSSSTLASSKIVDSELPTPEKDKETRIGQAFEASLLEMEKVYTDYIKNRHAANLRLEVIQKSHAAREWLKECKDNSSDITNAWNLDALLVKPVQRITKYPLLLKELVDATPQDHPDSLFLRKAMAEIIDVNMRINDVKKHAELVDQVLNRKRKDSDVRAGLSKAFGRRAEKLKQHVGITELYEDSKYNEIKIHYDNNIVQLMVVGNDCSSYGRAITKWVNKMVEIAAAAEAWVDVGHSHHQEAESRLRQFAMVVRGISTIALPDHLEQLNNKVLTPMQQAVDHMTRFKTDPKGLLQKREKRMIDYAQMKTRKDRGEKIDKKTAERMEQSEALNVEAKKRMHQLVTATAKLVQACQANLVQMQVNWQHMLRQKLSAAMGIPLEQSRLEVEDIEKEWQMDFDFQEASALSLGICNGSLLAEAVNMVNFQPSSSATLNGEESPRQPSFTSASKRSISLTSETSYPPIPDYDPRTSGMYGHQYHEPTNPYVSHRGRAQSGASAIYNRTPDLSQPGPSIETYGNYARLESASTGPRLSLDAYAPVLDGLQSEQPSTRPLSSSTFFSASGTPPPPPTQQQSRMSNIFSSAMPPSDAPTAERYFEDSAAAEPDVLFTAASVYEFNIDRSRREAGFPYLTYVTGEIFDIIGERGELWLAKNQDDPQKQIGWIWNKHFAKLAG